MCFSATASFTVAAVLLPAGLYSVSVAQRRDPRWVALAAYPAFFAIQQVAEGWLWLALDGNDTAAVGVAARSFLFFSHLFWLVWVPFSVYLIEADPWRQKVLLGLTVIGGVFGLSIAVPSIVLRDWLEVEVVRHSIQYKTTLIYDGLINKLVLRGMYAFIIVLPLMISSDWRIRLFGLAIAASLLLTFVYFAYAYISVWCFFAAILSLYLVIAMRNLGKDTSPRRSVPSEG